MKRNLLRPMMMLGFLALLLPVLTGVAAAQEGQRPKTEDLFPETAVVFVQIDDIRDFMSKMADSNFGRMLQDERIAPLAGELYQQALDAYSDVEDRVGLSAEEIQSLPAGELAFAVVAPKRKNPAIVFLIETDEENEAVNKALERLREAVENQAAESDDGEATDDDSEQDEESDSVESDDSDDSDDDDLNQETTDEVVYEKFRIDDQTVTIFRKNGTIVGSNNKDVLEDIHERWMGRPVEKVRPLSENRKFVTIMNRCRGSKDTPPEMRMYADPIEFARSATRGNIAAQAGLNMLPVLGLDGLLGIGGSVLFGEQDFESVFHGHLLLANPRKGIFEMIALKPADYRPQPWVPADIVSYMTTSWDIPTMFSEFEKIFDTFTQPGNFRENVLTEINEEIGLDLEEDIIKLLSGRFTYVQWNVKPYAFNSASNIIAAQVVDPERAEEVIDKLVQRILDEDEDNIVRDTYKGQDYWKMPDEQANRQREVMRENGVAIELRATQPAFALLGDHIIFCDHPDSLKRIIDTDRGDVTSLLDSPEFQVVMNKMTRLLGTDMPAALLYSRPAEQLRMWFEIANSEGTRGFLETAAEENRYAEGVLRAIEDNPLPDFEEIKHYFPPQGAFVTDDDTGYHMMTFSLKADDPSLTDR